MARGATTRNRRRNALLTLNVMRLLLFDLGFQVLLVGQDVALPLGDGLLLAHPDFLGDLRQQQQCLGKEKMEEQTVVILV